RQHVALVCRESDPVLHLYRALPYRREHVLELIGHAAPPEVAALLAMTRATVPSIRSLRGCASPKRLGSHYAFNRERARSRKTGNVSSHVSSSYAVGSEACWAITTRLGTST